jgi:Tol biopolymer transport system component
LYASGHILFLRENVLMARPFDPDRLEFTGDAFPFIEQVRFIPGAARGIFDASNNGILVYQSGARMPGNQIAWFDAEGKETGRLGESLEHDNPRISPDGKKVAVEIYDAIGGTPDIWIYDVDRGIRTRFTFDPSPETEPIWSPDGTRLAFSSGRNGSVDIYIKSILGGGDESPVLASSANKWPTSWTPDGRFILYQEASAQGTMDAWAVSADGKAEPFPIATSAYNEIQAVVSPNGRWVAYQSDEAGRFEVYVTSFPRPGRKWQVSLSGGGGPRWSSDGRRVYYISGNGELYHADVSSADSTFVIGESKLVFDVSSATAYDITPDGKRVLLLIDADQHKLTPLTLLTNWTGLIAEKRR